MTSREPGLTAEYSLNWLPATILVILGFAGEFHKETCTLEAETSVSGLTLCKVFISIDKEIICLE